MDMHRDINHSQKLWDQRPGLVGGILICIFAVSSFGLWLFLLTHGVGKLLLSALITTGISLIWNLFLIFKVGYDGFQRNYLLTYIVNVIVMVLAMYVLQVQFPVSVAGEAAIVGVWRFLVILIISLILNGMSTFLICGLVWLLMSLFGNMD